MARKEPEDLEAYMEECTRIEPLALEEEYIRLPSDTAYWAARYAAVLGRYLERRAVTKQMASELKRTIRDRLTVELPKKPTVSEVEVEVQTDPAYIAAVAEEDAAEVEKVWLGGFLEALRAKREMLVSLGAHIRMEREMNMRERL